MREVGPALDVDEMFPAKDQQLEVGDGISGRYIEKLENIGPNKSNVYVIESNGQRIGLWGSTVIDSKFERITIGKVVAVAYAGIGKSKMGKSYKDFKIGVGIDVVGDEGGVVPTVNQGDDVKVPF